MKDFKKYFIIAAEPEVLYAALTQEATIVLWTGAAAVMSTEPDSEFSLWDDSISGKNIAFEPGKKIVQQWYFGEEEATPSIVTIKLHEHPQGTSVELRHTNIPDEAYDDITEGWTDVYFAALEAFYA